MRGGSPQAKGVVASSTSERARVRFVSLFSQRYLTRAVSVTDISEDALATALENARRNGLAERFGTVRSKWFEAVDGRFDIIVSNPPYIRSNVIPELEPEVRYHDPVAALDGGEDGLDAYRAIASHAGRHLETDGVIGLEIGFDQKRAVTALFEAQGFRLLSAAKDLGGNDRVLVFQQDIERSNNR